MNGTRGRISLTLACCLLAFGAVGCASLDGLFDGSAWQKSAAADLPDVPSPAERIAALRQLAGEGPGRDPARRRELAQALAEAFHREQDPAIRVELVRALAAYPDEASDEALRSALGDTEVDVRVAACEAWGHRGNAEAVALLSGTLDGDLDTDVRLAAARALGRSKDPQAVAALGRALDDRDPAIQYRSVVSLQRVTGKDLGNEVGRWRQYVAAGLSDSPNAASLAERPRSDSAF
jgi:HEAT repeat protein